MSKIEEISKARFARDLAPEQDSLRSHLSEYFKNSKLALQLTLGSTGT